MFCFGLAIPMMVIAGNVDKGGALFFLSGAGLIIVGMATSFKRRLTDIAHYTGAGFGIVFALVGIGVAFNSWLPIILVAAVCAVIIKIRINNPVYWMEVMAIIGIVVGLLAR